MEQFSAYMLDPEHGWIGTHRLSRESAIRFCKENRDRNAGALVALVPDGIDPNPYFKLVVQTAAVQPLMGVFLGDRYGHCDTCGAPCDALGCTRDLQHNAALA